MAENGNGNHKDEIEKTLTPEREAKALEIAELARQIMPIEPSKCACPLAASKFQSSTDSFMEAISASPVLLIYPPHRDEDLDEIDYYARQTDELCGLNGILTELFDTGDKVRKIIEQESLDSKELQRIAQDEEMSVEEVNQNPAMRALEHAVWDFMLNKVSGRFRDKLKECLKEIPPEEA